jgi:hypothetical protein
LPSSEETAAKRGRFAETTIGYVHIDVCELRCAEGKVHMFLAIDRVSKFTYVELHPSATILTGAAFLRGVVAAFPCKLHTVLTNNGILFTDRPDKRSGPTAQYRLHVFDRVCRENEIVHKLGWRTPFQAICDAWTKDPTPFIINPHHLIPGLHT